MAGLRVKKLTGLNETLTVSTGLYIMLELVFECTMMLEAVYITGKSSILGTCCSPNWTHTTISSLEMSSLRAAHFRTPVDSLFWFVYCPPANSSSSRYLVT